MRFESAVALVAVALLAPSAAFAEQPHPAEATVRALTRSIDHFDLPGFLAAFHPEVTMFYPIDSIPRRVDGRDALAAVQERVFSALAGRFAAEGKTAGPYFGLEPLDLEVQKLAGGAAAVVTWHVDRGSHLGRRTAVVEPRDGAWKITSYHASNVARPAE